MVSAKSVRIILGVKTNDNSKKSLSFEFKVTDCEDLNSTEIETFVNIFIKTIMKRY